MLALFFKEFKALIFDPGFLRTLGYSTRWIDVLLMGLIALTVIVGLQAVGVVLVAAMLITPAVTARFWTERLDTMVFLSAFFGGFAGGVGTFISSLAPRIPTGPVMVLVATLCFVLSALLAPQRGVVARWLRERANSRREAQQHFLRAYVELQEKVEEARPLAIEELSIEMGYSPDKVRRIAYGLERVGHVEQTSGFFSLTETGLEEGLFVVKSHRLWEHYLYYRTILDADHVDRPADEVEHLLTPGIIARLEEILARERGIDPAEIVNLHRTGSQYRRGGRE